MKIAELMHTPAVMCRTTAMIGEVAQLMEARNVGSVLVVDKGDFLTGIVTDRDLAIRGYAHGLSADVPVTEAMTRNVATVVPYANPEEAAKLMADRGVRRLPVIDDDGRVHGVIALDDLIRHLTRQTDVLLATLSIQAERLAPSG